MKPAISVGGGKVADDVRLRVAPLLLQPPQRQIVSGHDFNSFAEKVTFLIPFSKMHTSRKLKPRIDSIDIVPG